MFFLVNASPPKRLDVASSYSADALVSTKDGVPSTEVKYIFGLVLANSPGPGKRRIRRNFFSSGCILFAKVSFMKMKAQSSRLARL